MVHGVSRRLIFPFSELTSPSLVKSIEFPGHPPFTNPGLGEHMTQTEASGSILVP